MDEFGFYSWQDGRKYEGFYKDDKKHGYGIYTWSDQKKYAGWWCNGKQHGLGVFISKEGKKKLGVWDEGKKLRWLSQEEAKAIENREINLRDLFTNRESYELIKDFDTNFTTPPAFFKSKQVNTEKIISSKIKVDFLENPRVGESSIKNP